MRLADYQYYMQVIPDEPVVAASDPETTTVTYPPLLAGEYYVLKDGGLVKITKALPSEKEAHESN